MKFLLVLATAVILSGCSIFGARYDNNEYASFVHLRIIAASAMEYCGDPETLSYHIKKLDNRAEFLYHYTKHLPKNNDTFDIATILRSNVNELDEAYTDGTASETYCRFKMELMIQHIDRALEAVAVKGR